MLNYMIHSLFLEKGSLTCCCMPASQMVLFLNLALVAIKSLNNVASSFLLGMRPMFNFNLQDGEGKYRW